MKALAIAGTNLRRLFRLRSNIFFVIIFPMLLILLLGATFGGGFTPVVGVVGNRIGPLGDQLVALLEQTHDLEVERYASENDVVNAVERGRVQGGACQRALRTVENTPANRWNRAPDATLPRLRER